MVLVSPHFSLAKLTTTEHREFLAEQADPPTWIRANLARLAYDLLEPAREIVGPLHVNSGFRCPGLNAAIGGSVTSAHMRGLAADVVPVDVALREAYGALLPSTIPYDQLIWEYGRWIHLGAAWGGQPPRRQVLMIFESGKYLAWDPADPRVSSAFA